MNPKSVSAIIFSKDRPMQLDATLRSLAIHCRDFSDLDIQILYTCSAEQYALGYRLLREHHAHRGNIHWLPESDFKTDVLLLLLQCDYVLWLVDDNIFVREFSIAAIKSAMETEPMALGFSLRLGENTTYCYSLDRSQAWPTFQQKGGGVLAYSWPSAECDFGYPLEVSSSLYRSREMIPFLRGLPFNNPNTLESGMAERAELFAVTHPRLLCLQQSVTFCNPVNKVQSVCGDNRAGASFSYSAAELARKFNEGVRIAVETYAGLRPAACHQEVALRFSEENRGSMVSVVIPCYKQAHFLPEAVESVLNQSYRNWECIIVNDGSPDNTSAVAREIIRANPGYTIRLVEKENGGLADARNTGIRGAQGTYILPLDADDKIHPDFLSHTVALLDAEPSVAIAYVDQVYFGAMSKNVECSEFNANALLQGNYFGYCSLYRKSIWETVGGYKRNMQWGYEDWEFWISCAEAGFSGRRVPLYLLWYRVKQDSMLTTAREHDAELRAQIVLNHPKLYPQPMVEEARRLLDKGNGQPHEAPLRHEGNFRVIAIISAHNEGDVIYHVIGDLISQGVEVYLLDHCSTDNTVAEAKKWLGKGLIHVENFPRDAGYHLLNEKQYIWYEILRRKEELASQLGGDWYIHADADEFRESPWTGYSLRTAIQAVDRLGYNAIDFALLNFRPTDDSFIPGSDVRTALRFFEWGEDFNALQIKCWKNQGLPIDLKNSGGHSVTFAGRRVFPIKFLLRHYPIRSQSHGMRKVFAERKPRFNQIERSGGWHVQYNDVLDTHHNFIRNPGELAPFDPQAVRLYLQGKGSSPPVGKTSAHQPSVPPPRTGSTTAAASYPLVPLVGSAASSPLQKLVSSERVKNILNRYTTD